MQVKTQSFRESSLEALASPQIQQALARVAGGFDAARQEAIRDLTPEVWDQYRERARRIKEHTIQHLDYYLDMLADRVEQNGGAVHFARDAQEATQVVLEVARSQGVKLVTKGKSMVTEEMGLNKALEASGIQVVETDLGEYIIQLADEAPFHIVAPAMHKSRQEVAELFAQKLGRATTPDAAALTRAARQALRQQFLQADMGITGVNFAVAETGTIAIFTNEGNGRLCTSLPRVHLAVMGMEKVVPSLEDLAVMLKLLPRAATGQAMTSYVTLVSGPRRRDEEDGPDQFHLVVLDNGRTKLLADPDLRESLYCIRCGACLNTCPVYQKVGGHAYGWVYQGPIGAVVTPVMTGLRAAADLPFASTLCGACRDACPLKINIPRMLLKLRQDLKEGPKAQRKVSWGERLLFRIWCRAVASEGSLGRFRSLARFLQLPLARAGRLRRIPVPPFSRWTLHRDFPTLARRSFHDIWKRKLRHEEDGKPT